MRAILSLSSRFLRRCLLSSVRCLLLLALLGLSASTALAQTATPTLPPFSTVAPGSTPTAGVPPSSNHGVSISFISNTGGCASLFGTWELGLGWTSDSGLIFMYCSYRVHGLVSAVIHYSSTVDGTFTLGVCLEGTTCEVGNQIYSHDVDYAECSETCNLNISGIGGIDMNNFSIATSNPDTEGVVAVRGVDFTFAESEADFDVVDGCPVLSPTEKAKLDPYYFAQCSRCFVDATPVHENPIVVPSLSPRATASADFSFPVISSGTLMTWTPAPGMPGFTPSPTASITPGASPTPLPFVTTYTFESGQPLPEFVGSLEVQVYAGSATGFGFLSTAESLSPTHSLEGTLTDGGGFHFSAIYATLHFTHGVFLQSAGFWTKAVSDSTLSRNITMASLHEDDSIMFEDDRSISNIANAGWVLNDDFLDAGSADVWGVSFRYVEGGAGGSTIHNWIDDLFLRVADEPNPTATPLPPTSTFSPWFSTPNVTPTLDCTVPVFRDDSPAAQFNTNFQIVDYQCFRVVPEIDIDIPGQDGLHVTGVDWCVTFFTLPLISIFGITVTMDWLAFPMIAYAVRILLSL